MGNRSTLPERAETSHCRGRTRHRWAMFCVSSALVLCAVGCGGGEGDSNACQACKEALAQCQKKCSNPLANCYCRAEVCAKPCIGS